jgi:N-acetylmuramoyl-L-alanine amidase
VQQFLAVNSPRLVLLAACLAAVPAFGAAEPVPVTVSIDTSGPSTRAVVTFKAPVAYRVQEDAGRVMVVCEQPLAPEIAERVLEDGIVKGFVVQGDHEIAFTTGRGYRRLESFELKNPSRLVLDFQGDRGARSVPAVVPGGGGQTIIVIDPGHGGVETGAIGPSGTKEKDVTLDLARRLKALLVKQGVTVVLTRDEDRVLPLDDRTAIANENRAELFVSIHLNASKRKSAYGAETYYLSTDATDDEARTLAALENKAYEPPGVTPPPGIAPADKSLELILWDLAQNSYLAESSRLAVSVQKELNDMTGVRDRGVRQAPFRVLMGATMPAILVEAGFISNPDEEARFKDDAYKDKVAAAIARAIAGFRRSVAALDTGPAASGAARP